VQTRHPFGALKQRTEIARLDARVRGRVEELIVVGGKAPLQSSELTERGEWNRCFTSAHREELLWSAKIGPPALVSAQNVLSETPEQSRPRRKGLYNLGEANLLPRPLLGVVAASSHQNHCVHPGVTKPTLCGRLNQPLKGAGREQVCSNRPTVVHIKPRIRENQSEPTALS